MNECIWTLRDREDFWEGDLVRMGKTEFDFQKNHIRHFMLGSKNKIELEDDEAEEIYQIIQYLSRTVSGVRTSEGFHMQSMAYNIKQRVQQRIRQTYTLGNGKKFAIRSMECDGDVVVV